MAAVHATAATFPTFPALETDMTPDDNYDPVTGATELTPDELGAMLWCCVIGLVAGLVLKILWGV